MKPPDGVRWVGKSDSLTSGTQTATDDPLTPYNSLMTNNPYVQQILSQGKEPSKVPAPKATYPRTIHGRVFATEADYRAALDDFLNGN